MACVNSEQNKSLFYFAEQVKTFFEVLTTSELKSYIHMTPLLHIEQKDILIILNIYRWLLHVRCL